MEEAGRGEMEDLRGVCVCMCVCGEMEEVRGERVRDGGFEGCGCACVCVCVERDGGGEG